MCVLDNENKFAEKRIVYKIDAMLFSGTLNFSILAFFPSRAKKLCIIKEAISRISSL